jgi:hypothetical protein
LRNPNLVKEFVWMRRFKYQMRQTNLKIHKIF